MTQCDLTWNMEKAMFTAFGKRWSIPRAQHRTVCSVSTEGNAVIIAYKADVTCNDTIHFETYAYDGNTMVPSGAVHLGKYTPTLLSVPWDQNDALKAVLAGVRIRNDRCGREGVPIRTYIRDIKPIKDSQWSTVELPLNWPWGEYEWSTCQDWRPCDKDHVPVV